MHEKPDGRGKMQLGLSAFCTCAFMYEAVLLELIDILLIDPVTDKSLWSPAAPSSYWSHTQCPDGAGEGREAGIACVSWESICRWRQLCNIIWGKFSKCEEVWVWSSELVTSSILHWNQVFSLLHRFLSPSVSLWVLQLYKRAAGTTIMDLKKTGRK